MITLSNICDGSMTGMGDGNDDIFVCGEDVWPHKAVIKAMRTPSLALWPTQFWNQACVISDCRPVSP